MVQTVRLRLKVRPLSTTSPGSPHTRLTISGTMSPNAITRRYPQTEMFFDQLHIDRRIEGYESLDELAWRHGVSVSQLLRQLRHALRMPPRDE